MDPREPLVIVRMRGQHCVRPNAGVVTDLVDLREHVRTPAVLATCGIGRMMVGDNERALERALLILRSVNR